MDITEVGQLCTAALPGEDPYVYTSRTLEAALSLTEGTIRTPIAFAHYPDKYLLVKDRLFSRGWKILTCALNWHDAHNGDGRINVFYKRFACEPLPVSPGEPHRESMYRCHKSWMFGCGGRLLQAFKHYPIGRNSFYPRFLTLFRVPKEKRITSRRLSWLADRHFRPVPELDTPVATYWVNGWKPEEYPGKVGERDFWQSKSESAS